MRYLRNTVYLILLLFASPFFLIRLFQQGKYRAGWSAKFLGKAPRRPDQRPCVWFHAVSVGEVKLLRPLIAEFARRRPEWEIVVSTTTATGLAVARREYPELITFYAPLDFAWAVDRAIERLRPTLLAFVELDLWPNWIDAAAASGTRIAVINARLSERSHRGYKRLGWLFRSTLRRIDLIATQSEEYARRFVSLGVEPTRVRVTGSIKYDGLESDRANPRTVELRRTLGLTPAEILFVAGSTMEGEEGAAVDAYRDARIEHPGLRLVIVPRHPERFDEVAALIASRGESVWRRSREAPAPRGAEPPPVLLVDTVGELAAVWGLADVAFVGGSLRPGRGGQNMMEPAAYGASVNFGSFTENFREATEGLLARDAARRVETADDLKRALREDLDDPEAAHARGQRARQFVLAQNGASVRTASELDHLLDRPIVRRRALLAC